MIFKTNNIIYNYHGTFQNALLVDNDYPRWVLYLLIKEHDSYAK